MPKISVCGIDCEACKHKAQSGCVGCRENEGKIFWGECDLYKCCAQKAQSATAFHCGACGDFPCETLEEWSKTENPERIGNLKKLVQEL